VICPHYLDTPLCLSDFVMLDAGSSMRAKLSNSVSSLWNFLFREDDTVMHAHVLQSFKRFTLHTTLASDGVNVLELSVPPEFKTQLAAILVVKPDSHLSSALPYSAWNPSSAERRMEQDACGAYRYRTLGALASTVAAPLASVAGGRNKTDGKWAAVERDCTAMELVLPRLQAAVRHSRPSPELQARLLALASRLESMRASLATASSKRL